MNCKDCQQNLHLYLEASLPEAELRAVSVHLESCAQCSLELERDKALLSTLRALPQHTAPPTLRASVRSRLEKEAPRQGYGKFAGGWFLPGLRQFAWTGSAALALLFIVMVARFPEPGPLPPTSEDVVESAPGAGQESGPATTPQMRGEQPAAAPPVAGQASPDAAKSATAPSPLRPPASQTNQARHQTRQPVTAAPGVGAAPGGGKALTQTPLAASPQSLEKKEPTQRGALGAPPTDKLTASSVADEAKTGGRLAPPKLSRPVETPRAASRANDTAVAPQGTSRAVVGGSWLSVERVHSPTLGTMAEKVRQPANASGDSAFFSAPAPAPRASEDGGAEASGASPGIGRNLAKSGSADMAPSSAPTPMRALERRPGQQPGADALAQAQAPALAEAGPARATSPRESSPSPPASVFSAPPALRSAPAPQITRPSTSPLPREGGREAANPGQPDSAERYAEQQFGTIHTFRLTTRVRLEKTRLVVVGAPETALVTWKSQNGKTLGLGPEWQGALNAGQPLLLILRLPPGSYKNLRVTVEQKGGPSGSKSHEAIELPLR